MHFMHCDMPRLARTARNSISRETGDPRSKRCVTNAPGLHRSDAVCWKPNSFFHIYHWDAIASETVPDTSSVPVNLERRYRSHFLTPSHVAQSLCLRFDSCGVSMNKYPIEGPPIFEAHCRALIANMKPTRNRFIVVESRATPSTVQLTRTTNFQSRLFYKNKQTKSTQPSDAYTNHLFS